MVSLRITKVNFLQAAIVLLIGYLILVAGANFYNANIPFINPIQNEPQVIPIILYYPPTSNPSPLPVWDINSNKSKNPPDFSVLIILQHYGTLSEGSRVDVWSGGHIDPSKARNYSGVDLRYQVISNFNQYNESEKSGILPHAVLGGFEAADQYDKSESATVMPGGQFWINLFPGDPSLMSFDPNKTPVGSDFPFTQSIKWYTQGDYYPYITVYFNNGTSDFVTYPDYKIHVSSSDIIQQEKDTRVTAVLSIVLLAFTALTGILYVFVELPEKYNEKKPPTNPETDPKETNPETKRHNGAIRNVRRKK